MKFCATPENTAVVTINDYSVPYPQGYSLFLESALRQSITIQIWKLKKWTTNGQSKTTALASFLRFLHPSFEYILFVDSRDVLFTQPLCVICDVFNNYGWPIVVSSVNVCGPHIELAWAERFGRPSRGYQFLNSGVWIGERQEIETAFAELESVKRDIRDGKVACAPAFLLHCDQFIWQAAYLDKRVVMRLDNECRLALTFTGNTPVEEMIDDGMNSKFGPLPPILHFSTATSEKMPEFFDKIYKKTK